MTRPMIPIGTAFLVTVFAVSFLRLPAVGWIAAVFGVLALAALCFLRGKRRALAAMLLCACLTGSLRAGISAWKNRFDFSACAGREYQIAGDVMEKQPSSDGRIRYRIRVREHSIPGAPKSFSAYLYASGEDEAGYGEILSVSAKCMPMTGTPGFDAERYYREQGISAVFSSYRPVSIRPGHPSPLAWIRGWHDALCRLLERHVAAPMSGLAKAILLGEDGGISDSLQRTFAVAGILHIFCVSGLHVSLFSGVVYTALGRLRIRRKLRVLLGLCLVWGFVALTGFGIPAVRAGIMASILLLGEGLHRPADPLNSLFLAGSLIGLALPEAISGGSFLLTFSATFGILEIGPSFEKRLSGRRKFPSWMSGALSLLCMTAGCSIAMFPVTWYLFRGISLAAPVSNLLVLPLMPVLLLLGILTLLAVPFPWLADWFGGMLEGLLHLLLRAAEEVGKLPFAYLGLNYRFVAVWAAMLTGAVFFCLLCRKKHLLGKVCLISCALFVIAGTFAAVWNRNLVRVAVVNSFEGSSVVFSRRGSASVVSLKDDKRLDYEVEEYLRSINVRRINHLILGYPNTEWAEDTVYLAKAIPVENLFLWEGDELYPYAKELLHPARICALGPGRGYLLRADGTARLVCGEDALSAEFLCGETKIVVANSPEWENCEILFWGGETFDSSGENSAEYVVLLGASDLNLQFFE
jgi:ComEC/Rec2-related protein